MHNGEIVPRFLRHDEDRRSRRRIPLLVQKVEGGVGQDGRIQPESGRPTQVFDGRFAAQPTIHLGAKPGDLGSGQIPCGLAVGAFQQSSGQLGITGVEVLLRRFEQHRCRPWVSARIGLQQVPGDVGDGTPEHRQDVRGMGVDLGSSRRLDLLSHAVPLEGMNEVEWAPPLEHTDIGEGIGQSAGQLSFDSGHRGRNRQVDRAQDCRCLQEFEGAVGKRRNQRQHRVCDDG